MTVPCSYYILDITQYHYKSFLTILGKTLESKKGKKKSTDFNSNHSKLFSQEYISWTRFLGFPPSWGWILFQDALLAWAHMYCNMLA